MWEDGSKQQVRMKHPLHRNHTAHCLLLRFTVVLSYLAFNKDSFIHLNSLALPRGELSGPLACLTKTLT